MAIMEEWTRDWNKVSVLLTIALFLIGSIVIPILFSRSSEKKSQERHNDVTAGIAEMHKRFDKNMPLADIEAKAKNTFELGKNLNANFIYKKGYEKKGGMGTWLTPGWEEKPESKFYLLDFVGNLDRNRISIFITEKNKLIAQILTADARKEIIDVNIEDWKKGEPHLVILQWNTDEDRVQLYVDRTLHEKTIPNLSFEVLGPVIFMGMDFEGKFPGRFQRGGPKISEGLKSIGMKEYTKFE